LEGATDHQVRWKWEVGSVTMWDNRISAHRVIPGKYKENRAGSARHELEFWGIDSPQRIIPESGADAHLNPTLAHDTPVSKNPMGHGKHPYVSTQED